MWKGLVTRCQPDYRWLMDELLRNLIIQIHTPPLTLNCVSPNCMLIEFA
jgi:hypothetical protein